MMLKASSGRLERDSLETRLGLQQIQDISFPMGTGTGEKSTLAVILMSLGADSIWLLRK